MTYDPSPITPAPGQAMVEMALVIGILLLVILGGIDVLQVQIWSRWRSSSASCC